MPANPRAVDIRVVADTSKLDFLPERVLQHLRDAVREVAENAVEIAKSLAPVDTGALRDSIDVEYGDDGVGGLNAVLTVNVPYGLYQELGTKYVAAHPFLAPAMEMVQDDLRPALARAIEMAAEGE